MRFEWDEAKTAANITKHGVSFPQAVRIFEGPVLSRIDDRIDYGGERTISFGAIDETVIVMVVHTDRSGVTWVISASLASARERKVYHAAL